MGQKEIGKQASLITLTTCRERFYLAAFSQNRLDYTYKENKDGVREVYLHVQKKPRNMYIARRIGPLI